MNERIERSMTDRWAPRPVATKSFAAALYLMGRGHEPETVISQESGQLLVIFNEAASADFNEFHVAQRRLHELTLDAQGGTR